MKLEIIIDEDIFHYKFFPFINRVILKDKMRCIQVINYNPISEYGGWGIRYGKNGWAYTVKGVYAIKIITSYNKTILIGTSNPEKVSKFLKEYYSTIYNAYGADMQ